MALNTELFIRDSWFSFYLFLDILHYLRKTENFKVKTLTWRLKHTHSKASPVNLTKFCSVM